MIKIPIRFSAPIYELYFESSALHPQKFSTERKKDGPAFSAGPSDGIKYVSVSIVLDKVDDLGDASEGHAHSSVGGTVVNRYLVLLQVMQGGAGKT